MITELSNPRTFLRISYLQRRSSNNFLLVSAFLWPFQLFLFSENEQYSLFWQFSRLFPNVTQVHTYLVNE